MLSTETPSGFDLSVRVHEHCLDKAFPKGWKS